MQIIVLPERERTKWSVAQTLWDMDRTPLISPCANNFQDFNASLHGLNEVRRTCWLLRGLMGCWLAQRGRRDNRARWLSRLIKNEGAEVSCQAADPAPALKSLGDVLSLPVLSPPPSHLRLWCCWGEGRRRRPYWNSARALLNLKTLAQPLHSAP